MKIRNAINVIDPKAIKYVNSDFSIVKKRKHKRIYTELPSNIHSIVAMHCVVLYYFGIYNLRRQSGKSRRD
jgi:hypothetical protein